MQRVTIKIHDSIATILLEHPESRNAIGPRMIEDLKTAFSDVHQESRVRSVIVSSSGEHFSSGLDLVTLDEISKLPIAQSHEECFNLWRQYAELLEQLLRFPKPVIAAVDGAAIGAGLGIALACDIMLVTTRASLVADAVRRGLVGGTTAALLSFRVGSAVASKMLLSGEPLDSDEAYRRGLCERPVAPEMIWVAGAELAGKCGLAPREAIQATKRILNESVGEALLEQLAACSALSATACTTESAKEGITAFNENRPPSWLDLP